MGKLNKKSSIKKNKIKWRPHAVCISKVKTKTNENPFLYNNKTRKM